jgi:DNA-binding CsgD family transcriptional regulator
LYREVMLSLGIRAVALSVLQLHGQMSGCMYLGRTSRGARFGTELVALRRALPVLALGHRLYEQEAGFTPRARFLAQLTDREKEVLWHLSRGVTNALIAERLGTSPSTVKNQVSALLAKAGVRNRTELVHLITQGRDEHILQSPS